MNALLYFITFGPLAAYLVVLAIPSRSEKALSRWTVGAALAHLAAILAATAVWLVRGRTPWTDLNIRLYETDGYQFIAAIHLDSLAAVFLLLGSALFTLIAAYSSVYMHREKGFARFFANIWFFYMGYTVTVVAGNFETLFAGWEILGVSSFLLIAFYRDRYLPVKNALKVFSIYRIADVGLLLAMWMSHHFWHANVHFSMLEAHDLVREHMAGHQTMAWVIAAAVLLTAMAKSAQLPFTTWLPRAMEGPTPSSAIFYGSLSVHMGAFILLRTHAFWMELPLMPWIVGGVGLSTALIATGIARVQSSVKAQIAYASAAQIGLIFVEIALGWNTLALVHISGNALLRTYQLLISPSAVTYQIREQLFGFDPSHRSLEGLLPRRLRNTLYMLAIKEFNLDTLMYRSLWNPIKAAGRKLDFLTVTGAMALLGPVVLGLVVLLVRPDWLPPSWAPVMPYVAACIALASVLKAFAERTHARLAWFLLVMNHSFLALSVAFNSPIDVPSTLLYLGGIYVAAGVGVFALERLRRHEGRIDLTRFHGHFYEHPRISFAVLLASLGISGFPITTAFLGEDLLFSHIKQDQLGLAVLFALSFVVDGLAAVRIFARIFFGPHVKTYHEVAYRSS
jgi:hypothetical protein